MIILTFNGISFKPINKANQIWLTSAELAKALGYAETDSVTKLYNRHIDEFKPSMTQVIDISETVKLTVPKNQQNLVKKMRIFNLRGCHLIAMFAKTKIAKEFRQWVLDILDKEVGQPTIQKTTVDERIPLKNAVNLLVAKGSLNYSECYKLVHQYMGVNHIDEIPLDDLPKAVEYVHHLILQIDKSGLDDKSEYNAFWRMVGLLEYDRISREIQELDDMLATISSRFHRLNKTKGLLFDSLSEQKINARADMEKVQGFIHKQMMMKEKLNFFC